MKPEDLPLAWVEKITSLVDKMADKIISLEGRIEELESNQEDNE